MGKMVHIEKEYLEVTLRPVDEICLPFCLPRALLMQIGDKYIVEETLDFQADLEESYPALAKWLSRGKAPLLIRCYSHVLSRYCLASEADDEMSSGYSIVPFFELINHSTEPNCECVQTKHEITDLPYGEEDVWILRNADPVQRDEQLTVSYCGPAGSSNQFLFKTYGFVLEGYADDTLELPPSQLDPNLVNMAVGWLEAEHTRGQGDFEIPYIAAGQKSLVASMNKATGSSRATVTDLINECKTQLAGITHKL